MRVGIDATVVAQPYVVGIGRFIRNLVSAFAASDVDHEFVLYYRLRNLKHPSRLWRPRDPRFHIRFLAGATDPFLLSRLDVFHATYARLPSFQGATPYLATVHDIFYAARPDMANPDACRLWVDRYRDIARRCRLIMTVSEYSKRDMVEFLGIEPERVRVVLEAAADGFRPCGEREVATARQRYGLAQPFVLFGGGFDRRKNLPGALRAFARAADRLPRDLALAVTGGGGESEAEARRVVASLGLEERVRFLGFVPDADFPALMSGCESFFFPSLFEGFGLPALEAMACGAAVVASSTTSLPEICGDAARLVDPEDIDEMAGALVELSADPARRAALRQRGLARAHSFTWQKAARETLDLYREVARGCPAPLPAGPTAAPLPGSN